MIFDQLEHLEQYKDLHPRFADAMAFLRELLDKNAENGRHVLPSSEGAIAVTLSEYTPKALADGVRMEAHESFIDIQVLLEGEEYMYVPSEKSLPVVTPYDPATDCAFYEMPTEDRATRICVPKGYFTVFFAGELHAPGVASPSSSHRVRKAVVKVLKETKRDSF